MGNIEDGVLSMTQKWRIYAIFWCILGYSDYNHLTRYIDDV